MTESALRRRVLIAGVIVPVVIALIGCGLIVAWLPSLPDSVITHWGTSGADGYGPPWTYLVIVAGVTILTAGVLGSVVLASLRGGALSIQQKILTVASFTLTLFLTAAVVALLGAQRGGGQPDATIALLASFALAAGVGALGWVLLPPASGRGSSAGQTPTPLVLAATERAVWTRRAASSVGLLLGLAGLCVVLVVVVALAATSTNPGLWWFQLIPVLLLVATLSSLIVTVRVDERGLDVRGLLGLPRFRVPLDQVGTASVVSINPLVDFGGWGIRVGAGSAGGRARIGVILRGGEALEVLRTTGRSFVVTVDDADGAAALLTSLAARAAHPA